VRATAVAAIGIAAVLALAGLSAAGQDHRSPEFVRKVWPRVIYPRPAALRRAQVFAAGRGDVSFAVIDSSLGLRGYDLDREYSSASVSKALLLAAELRRLNREHLPLDEGTKALLEPMVTYSDNRAADAIYAEVGDEGLEEVAERAGMRDFEPIPGFWGGDKVTAADLARFFYRLDANLPGPHRAYAKRLLARIAPVERWGIPVAAGRGWRLWFKGGWRPPEEKNTSGPVTNQAALLVHRNGERLAVAVLTDEAPGSGGISDVEETARLLIGRPPPDHRGWLAP
jgi:Beta-lactamase enzyme family